jgi:hypothetical protein
VAPSVTNTCPSADTDTRACLKRIGLFLLLWLAGLIGLPYVPYGDALFSPFVGVLDIALVFVASKGDVRFS